MIIILYLLIFFVTGAIKVGTSIFSKDYSGSGFTATGWQIDNSGNTQIYSNGRGIYLQISDSDAYIYANGGMKFRVTNNGKIYMYNVLYNAAGTNGTGQSRYKLYVDEYGQVCRANGSGW